MSESPAESNEGASVPQAPHRFTGAALDRVKLELAGVLVTALALYAVVEVTFSTGWLQVLLLAVYGAVAGLWLTMRARRVLNASSQAAAGER